VRQGGFGPLAAGSRLSALPRSCLFLLCPVRLRAALRWFRHEKRAKGRSADFETALYYPPAAKFSTALF